MTLLSRMEQIVNIIINPDLPIIATLTVSPDSLIFDTLIDSLVSPISTTVREPAGQLETTWNFHIRTPRTLLIVCLIVCMM